MASDFEQEAMASQTDASNELDSLPKFKFMTNIFLTNMDQTFYIKQMEKLSPDAQVSYKRVITAVLVMVVALFIWLQMGVFVASTKFAYVFLPMTMMFGAVATLSLVYLVSARNKSMLAASGNLMLHPIMESIRQSGGKGSDIKSFGIKDFSGGVIRFSNGDFGVVYQVDGQLGKSTLPQVAQAVTQARSNYITIRNPDSQEMLIVSVREVETIDQQRNLKRYMDMATSDSYEDMWIRYMVSGIQREIITRINYEYTIVQYVILRNKSVNKLKQDIEQFDSAVVAGLYSRAERIMLRRDFVKAFGTLTMLSKKGAIKYGKDEANSRQRR